MTRSITFLGDLCLAGKQIEYSATKDDTPWRPISELFSDSFIVANLECPISEKGESLPLKYATLRAVPEAIRYVAGLNLAIVANNHFCDYGIHAAEDTIKLLTEHGIGSTGFGKNIADAARPYATSIDDVRFLVFAASCPTTNGENLATHTSCGVAPMSTTQLQQALIDASTQQAIKVVYLHWGLEHEHRVVPEQVAIARAVVDWGADLVVGCHGHVIQPYEQYNGKWIFYGLGNFLFDDVVVQFLDSRGCLVNHVLKQQPKNKESIAAQFTINHTATGATLSLKEVVPLSFGTNLFPSRITESELTVSLADINKSIPESQPLSHYSQAGGIEPLFVTQFRNGILSYFYRSEIYARPQCITLPKATLTARLLARFVRFLRRLVG